MGCEGTWTSSNGRSCTLKRRERMAKEHLDLRNKEGILLLYIQRSQNRIIGVPGPDHKLREGDWIYLARDLSVRPSYASLDLSPEDWKQNILRYAKAVEDDVTCEDSLRY